MMPISMNFSSERKHTMKSLLTAISLALAFVSPAFAGIEWGFPDNSTTVVGTDYLGSGSGTATIHLGSVGGSYGDVSHAPWNSFGSAPGATGLWDLGGYHLSGTPGSIVLSSLSGSGLTTLTVFQWVQPGGTASEPYNGSLGFAVSGGASGPLLPVVPVTSVGWWEYAANLGAFTPGETVTVTASAGGAIIDRLTLVPEPATMIAAAVLLIPFALSTWPILRRRRSN
jgi:hypothetical protein